MAAPKQRGWFGTLIQQIGALLVRNFIIAWRQLPATLLRLSASFFFLFVLWMADVAIQKDSEDLDQFKEIREPEAEAIGAIPSCEEDYYIRTPCLDLLFTPNTPEAEALIDAIRVNNPGRVIPKDKTRGFPDREAANQYLLGNIDTVIAAVHLDIDMENQFIGYALQTNSTVKFFRDDFQDFNTFVQLPLQQAVGREATRLFMKEAADGVPEDFAYNLSTRPYAHPPTDTFSLVGEALGFFLFAANMFAFVMQLFTIVREKEYGLRQALYSMGLMYSSNLMALCIFEGILVFVSSILMSSFGYVFSFDLYTKNSFGLLLLLFFLFQLAMSSFAVLLAPFFNKANTTIYFGFAIFIVGWVMQGVVQANLVYAPKYYYRWGGVMPIIFSLFPWPLFVKGITDLGSASAEGEEGLSFSQRDTYCRDFRNDPDGALAYRQSLDNDNEYFDDECVLSLDDVFTYMTIQVFVYIFLGVYLDNVLKNEKGVRQAPWYFLNPGYWFPSRSRTYQVADHSPNPSKIQTAQSIVSADHSLGLARRSKEVLVAQNLGEAVETSQMEGVQQQQRLQQLQQAPQGTSSGGEDQDVRAERERLMEANKSNDPRQPLEIMGLCKTFGKFKAVDNAWWSARQGTVLALLGPNGAGKTTTINCLTGLLPLTGGDAIMHGELLSSAGGLNRIRKMMGVCPQFDVLWSELTGMEHVQLFARIKGLSRSDVNQEAIGLLDKVRLLDAQKQRVGSYSGGMKRRLSVALSLLGDPKIVFLDEPTTGMDPIARRYVWDVIEASKPGRVIVLTTHSMEEADILGDKVAIMARGQLRCIGTSLRLKQRFGGGYYVVVSVNPPKDQGASPTHTIKKVIFQHLSLEHTRETTSQVEYRVPRDLEHRLPQMLRDLEMRKKELGIADIQLSLTTLEDVFLGIAKAAELEYANNQGGQFKEAVLQGSGTGRKKAEKILKIPVGMEELADPDTGVRYTARWGTDEQGRLQLLEVRLAPGQVNVPDSAQVVDIRA